MDLKRPSAPRPDAVIACARATLRAARALRANVNAPEPHVVMLDCAQDLDAAVNRLITGTSIAAAVYDGLGED